MYFASYEERNRICLEVLEPVTVTLPSLQGLRLKERDSGQGRTAAVGRARGMFLCSSQCRSWCSLVCVQSWWIELEAGGSRKCSGVRAALAGSTPQRSAGHPGGPHLDFTSELMEEAFF